MRRRKNKTGVPKTIDMNKTFITIRNTVKANALLGMLLFLTSCFSTQVDQTMEEIMGVEPVVVTFEPKAAGIKEFVTVYGENLSFVDSAYVGGVLCPIQRRVNSKELIIQVSPEAKSGQIRLLTSVKKQGVSSEHLTVTYPTPSVEAELSDIPQEAFANEVVVLGGSGLTVVDKVLFGDKPGNIIYQGGASIAVLVPSFDFDQVVDIKVAYPSQAGSQAVVVKSGFQILTPSPKVTSWLKMAARGKSYTLQGSNMNMVEKVLIDNVEATITEAQPSVLSFTAPTSTALTTGHRNIKLQYTNNGIVQFVEHPIAYIGGKLETYFDFEDNSLAALTLQSGHEQAIVANKINGTVEQAPFPAGNSYYHLKMLDVSGDAYNAGGSSITYFRFDRQSNNNSWLNIYDDYTGGAQPVLHFWLNVNNTTPTIRLYMTNATVGNAFIRIKNFDQALYQNLFGADGKEWALVAIRLYDLFPGVTKADFVSGKYMRMNFLVDNQPDKPLELNMDWVSISDKVLSEVGAVDITDALK